MAWTAALPFCLSPKTRSIHWHSVWETCSDSSACRWIRMNRRGSLRAQGGKFTWFTLSPFWRTPKSKPVQANFMNQQQWKMYEGQKSNWGLRSERKMITLSVDQEFWEVEKLWDELFYVSHGLEGRQSPRGVHGVERSVRDIKALVWVRPKTF